MIIRKHDLLNSKTEFDSDIPNFLDMWILILKDQVPPRIFLVTDLAKFIVGGTIIEFELVGDTSIGFE